ncbi:MAG: hypothetical protein A3G33_00265 [Omnitrophica bacterium RIFCSPLOWO2_12_FULL_44_17]|uniref:DUF4145 domain-containing protein n=1 Tax=Candidatus Danuiimicrobium aquiferis TaxID=1801832 RepID=A0A1G1L3Z5_9BACT|nr:MAG: hypothetical protein A3E74_06710 [Omnitrophica bacterium RIFCSPHIGHO2_12_FULL_44_12]OGW99599.1 MAG: hypothetical protein A3G33_00265 [Omnitrophica bacterium RIFCSPLOWO2_12_FULL_44_17]OGX04676.1 MAG: hypothetical protein A3J12_06665 [Omnitrophica bacterium RIFCSPLOWO2_02_FULL_44_11]
MENVNFTCPYCSRHTTITEPNQFNSWEHFSLNKSKLGDIGLYISAITCPNKDCGRLFLKVFLTDAKYSGGGWTQTKAIQEWQLLPESEAKVLPDYIPPAIQEDYYESCRICKLSPKASATLARRCLQGMIRDFWDIRKNRLKDEVDALQSKVDPLVWEGIDAVRNVGNIGAHMEKDIDLIVGVEPDEAKLLIGLIETLIDDWYVDRKKKQDQLEKIKLMATEKKNAQKEDNK